MNGTKYDGGKNRLDLILAPFIWEVGEVVTHGAIVYGDYNWADVENADKRYRAALHRHYLRTISEPYDSETKLSHWAHVATNAMFLWHFEVNRRIEDIHPCVCEKCTTHRESRRQKTV